MKKFPTFYQEPSDYSLKENTMKTKCLRNYPTLVGLLVRLKCVDIGVLTKASLNLTGMS